MAGIPGFTSRSTLNQQQLISESGGMDVVQNLKGNIGPSLPDANVPVYASASGTSRLTQQPGGVA